jgi:Sec-independent protein translocase protein TatA
MFGIGPSELFIIVLLAVLLFGRNLPSIARQVGKTVGGLQRELRQAVEDTGLSEARREVEEVRGEFQAPGLPRQRRGKGQTRRPRDTERE